MELCYDASFLPAEQELDTLPKEKELTERDGDRCHSTVKRKLSDASNTPNPLNKKAKHDEPESIELELTVPIDAFLDFGHCKSSIDEVTVDVTISKLFATQVGEDYATAMKRGLDIIASALTTPNLKEVTRLISDFNQMYHLQGSEMEHCNACGHQLVIQRLLKRLRSLILQRSPVAETFKSEGCFLLGLLSRNECGRNLIIKERGITYILDQLKSTTYCLTTLRYCCYAMGNLVTSVSEEEAVGFHDYIVAEGVIPFLFDILKQNMDNWQFAQQVFFAIGNLAFVSDFEPIILQCGGVLLASDFLRKFPDRWTMATDTIFFLKNIAYGEPGREAILASGATKYVLETVWRNYTHSELVELSLNLFFDLSFSGGAEELTKDPEPVRFFISLLKTHHNSVPPLLECVRTLARIYTISNECTRTTMIKEGLIDHLVPLFSFHKTHKTFQKQLDAAFSRISREKIPTHQYSPDETVPSLRELAARAMIDKKLTLPSEFCPDDVKEFLAENKQCDICSCCYIDLHHEIIIPSRYSAWQEADLPVFLNLCSKDCLEHVKQGKRPKLVHTSCV